MTVMVESLPGLRAQAEQPVPASGRAILLAGSSDAVASAVLQQLVQEIASGIGISFTSVETLPPQQEERYRRIRLRLAFVSSWPMLVRLMAAIQQADPQMLIENLAVETSQGTVHAGDLPLSNSFTILGFREDIGTVTTQ